MIYLVDSSVVAPQDTEPFLAAFRELFLPRAERQGMQLVACWHTPEGLGEDVTVMAVFALRDWAHWNDVRRELVLDAASVAWLEQLEALRRSGSRRFYLPAELSPLG